MHKIFNMKTNFKIVLFLLITFNTFSQNGLDSIAKETCECIKNKKIDFSAKDENALAMEFGMCIYPSYIKFKDQLANEDKVETGDRDGLKKLGEKVALKMMNHCPDFIMELGKKYLDEEDENEAVVDSAAVEEVENLSIEGEVVEIKTEQFVTFQVKDKNLRVHNLILLDYFETVSLFIDDKIKKNSKVIISYSEIELYDPKQKEFRYYKVISGFEKSK